MKYNMLRLPLLFLLVLVKLTALTTLALAEPSLNLDRNTDPSSSDSGDLADRGEIAGIFVSDKADDDEDGAMNTVLVLTNEYKGDELVRQSLCSFDIEDVTDNKFFQVSRLNSSPLFL